MKALTFFRAIAALLVLMTVPVLAETTTLTGTVAYRERIALPPDTWLHVTVVEVESGRPIVGASATLPAQGQVPISFVLNVKSDIDLFVGRYGLVAEIDSKGRTLFRNPVPEPLSNSPIRVLLNFLPSMASSETTDAAAPPLSPLPPGIVDTVWTVTSIGGRPVTGSKPLTLSIAADLRAGGFGGCNHFFTEAQLADGGIEFGPTAATRMACLPELMEQEAAYFTALAAVSTYEQDERGLRLTDGAGIPLVGLVRAEEE